MHGPRGLGFAPLRCESESPCKILHSRASPSQAQRFRLASFAQSASPSELLFGTSGVAQPGCHVRHVTRSRAISATLTTCVLLQKNKQLRFLSCARFICAWSLRFLACAPVVRTRGAQGPVNQFKILFTRRVKEPEKQQPLTRPRPRGPRLYLATVV